MCFKIAFRSVGTPTRENKAGADVIVVGNAIEKDPDLIKEMAAAVHSVAVKV